MVCVFASDNAGVRKAKMEGSLFPFCFLGYVAKQERTV